MKTRKHHNNKGRRQIKTGSFLKGIKKLAKKLKVKFEGALSCSSMFSHTKVMYKGIEVLAPSPQKHGFYYSFSPPMGGYAHRNFETIEEALEKLKVDREFYPTGFFPDRIEERITITHKVKLT